MTVSAAGKLRPGDIMPPFDSVGATVFPGLDTNFEPLNTAIFSPFIFNYPQTIVGVRIRAIVRTQGTGVSRKAMCYPVAIYNSDSHGRPHKKIFDIETSISEYKWLWPTSNDFISPPGFSLNLDPGRYWITSCTFGMSSTAIGSYDSYYSDFMPMGAIKDFSDGAPRWEMELPAPSIFRDSLPEEVSELKIGYGYKPKFFLVAGSDDA